MERNGMTGFIQIEGQGGTLCECEHPTEILVWGGCRTGQCGGCGKLIPSRAQPWPAEEDLQLDRLESAWVHRGAH
jgi:hypothetical protein